MRIVSRCRPIVGPSTLILLAFREYLPVDVCILVMRKLIEAFLHTLKPMRVVQSAINLPLKPKVYRALISSMKLLGRTEFRDIVTAHEEGMAIRLEAETWDDLVRYREKLQLLVGNALSQSPVFVRVVGTEHLLVCSSLQETMDFLLGVNLMTSSRSF